MTVPVMFRGPDLEHLYHMPHMWLKDLAGNVPGFSLEGFLASPPRDHHILQVYIGSSGETGIDFSYSPLYRLRLGGSIEPDSTSFQEVKSGSLRGEWDIFSTYISRLWLGPEYTFGVGDDGAGLRAFAELTLGRKEMYLSWHLRPELLRFSHSLGVKLTPSLSLQLKDFSRLGFGYRF